MELSPWPCLEKDVELDFRKGPLMLALNPMGSLRAAYSSCERAVPVQPIRLILQHISLTSTGISSRESN